MFDITNIMHEGNKLMKKKLLTVLLTISMAVSVVACGNGEGASEENIPISKYRTELGDIIWYNQ